MRLLILGGTWFLGRTVAELAVQGGWEVTAFSRGLHGRDVPGVRPVRGDRGDRADVGRLASRGPWDAVVDTSGYVPDMTGMTASVLRGAASRYVYVSTVNAYRGWPEEPLDDDSPVYDAPPGTAAGSPGAARGIASAAEYGQLKAACERAVRRHFGDRDCLILRPGVILGPYEYVGRLPWLLRRMERGGRVLAAGDPGRRIQPVDVRDLAAFILRVAGAGLAGAMNVTAPVGHSTYGEMLGACREVTGRAAELAWVDGEWLAGQGVTPWTEIPLWRPAAGAWNVSSPRARAEGLACRPLPETVADTWEWLQREEPVPHPRAGQTGIAPDAEERLLAAWDEHAAASR